MRGSPSCVRYVWEESVMRFKTKGLYTALALLLALAVALAGVPAQALAEGIDLGDDPEVKLAEPDALEKDTPATEDVASEEELSLDGKPELEEELVLEDEGEPELAEETASATNGEDVTKGALTPSVAYYVHRQTYGWESAWSKRDGAQSGTTGRSKRLEAIKIKLARKPCSGGIQYCTHVQTYGWQDWRSDGAMSGTEGKSKRLEAIQVRLTGEMAERYDVWYRVHAQHFGWMGWASNGASAGTAGYAYRLEAIQIVIRAKGEGAPPASFRGATRQTSAAFSELKPITISGLGWTATLPKYWTGRVSATDNSTSWNYMYYLCPTQVATNNVFAVIEDSDSDYLPFSSAYGRSVGTVTLKNGTKVNVYEGEDYYIGFTLRMSNGYHVSVISQQVYAANSIIGYGLSSGQVAHIGSLQSLGTMRYGTNTGDYRVPLKCLQAIASGLSY